MLLRDQARPALSDERRELLLAVIHGSTIARPVSPHDSMGAFGRFGTLDRAEAD